MDVITIRQEGVLTVTDTVQVDAHYVKTRDKQGGVGQDYRVDLMQASVAAGDIGKPDAEKA
jgi:hypothetical protein